MQAGEEVSARDATAHSGGQFHSMRVTLFLSLSYEIMCSAFLLCVVHSAAILSSANPVQPYFLIISANTSSVLPGCTAQTRL
jgi:hypothetical protein